MVVIIVIIIFVIGGDFIVDILVYLNVELNQIVKEEDVAGNVLKEVTQQIIPTLRKEEIYDLIKNVDSEGNIEVDEQIYNKNKLLFEEVQKELDEEYFSYVENVPIKKK